MRSKMIKSCFNWPNPLSPLRELIVKQAKVAWASEAEEVAEVEEVQDLQILHVDLADRGGINMKVQTHRKIVL